MSDIVIVKSDFGGDIRRFAVPMPSFTLKYVKTTISVLYQLPIDSVSMLTMKTNEESSIKSDEELKSAVESNSTSGKIAKIVVKNIPSSPDGMKEGKREDISQEPTEKQEARDIVAQITLTDELVDQLMDHPKVQQRILGIVTACLNNKKYLSKISRKIEKRQRNSKKLKESERGVFNLTNSIDENSAETKGQSSPETYNSSNENEISKEKEETTEEKVVDQNQSKEDLSDIPSQFEVLDKIESPKETKISDVIEAKLEALSSSPIIQSFLALFKSAPKKDGKSKESKDSNNNNSDDEKTVPDDMLKQLEDMGFSDREANIRALKFHNKFNEGIDAVVENLLQNSASKEQEQEKVEVREDASIMLQY